VSTVYWPPDRAKRIEDFGSPKEPTVPIAFPRPLPSGRDHFLPIAQDTFGNGVSELVAPIPKRKSVRRCKRMLHRGAELFECRTQALGGSPRGIFN
jgi:hypothetical protein